MSYRYSHPPGLNPRFARREGNRRFLTNQPRGGRAHISSSGVCFYIFNFLLSCSGNLIDLFILMFRNSLVGIFESILTFFILSKKPQKPPHRWPLRLSINRPKLRNPQLYCLQIQEISCCPRLKTLINTRKGRLMTMTLFILET
jgi:hypothetical protein